MKKISFQSKLERIAEEVNYFAVSVPLKVTEALKTKGPVPVFARINHSDLFRVSLFPVGNGRHYIRVKAEIREQAQIKGGDRVKVEITVRDRSKEISIPKDLLKELKSEGVLEAFKSFPVGKKSYMLKWIDDAVKEETRMKRIASAVKAAHQKREKESK